MKLLNVQTLCNEIIDIERFKLETEEGLHTYLNNRQYLREEFGVDVDTFRIEYEYLQLFINTFGNTPFFRVKYLVYVNEEASAKFSYEVEFGSGGEVWDDYFDLVDLS
jgi:hypothetical protein